ncbi:hypothetical protein P171DRAFT_485987 [Karstenula rhodostoma CBS 690.94]|uniref:Uncharacterized protein n=1 Tax=Karstenula rhodostoma CBS 690.94 TaxID=1392251 RepID=A0A9P4PJX0_9PLEO|nr:hypothetical protein P171DRAFT_485987 [Karstenula rhodostoma CBS 690.94]
MEYLAIAEQIQRLGDKTVDDRPRQLIRAVRQAWHALEAHDGDEALAHHLIRLLGDLEDFKLASMVLPALRSEAESPGNGLQRMVLGRVAEQRQALSRITGRTQGDFDQPFYVEEKSILQESEMYRLGLLLFESNVLTGLEAQELRRWLDECPLRACDEKNHTRASSEGFFGARDAKLRTLREADVHRLRLILFTGRTLTFLERETVLQWLEVCPLRV